MKSLLQTPRSLFALREYLMQALFPEPCLHCATRIPESGLICTACAAALPYSATSTAAPNAYYATQYLHTYEGVQKSLFKAAKFGGRWRAESIIFGWARPALKSLAAPDSIFLPMPSSRVFLTDLLRSALPAEVICSGVFGLRSKNRSERNKHLGEAARFRRIRESLFLMKKPIPEAERYILCDDVLTTGATLGQAAWLLEQGGVPREKIVLWALLFRKRDNDDAV